MSHLSLVMLIDTASVSTTAHSFIHVWHSFGAGATYFVMGHHARRVPRSKLTYRSVSRTRSCIATRGEVAKPRPRDGVSERDTRTSSSTKSNTVYACSFVCSFSKLPIPYAISRLSSAQPRWPRPLRGAHFRSGPLRPSSHRRRNRCTTSSCPWSCLSVCLSPLSLSLSLSLCLCLCHSVSLSLPSHSRLVTHAHARDWRRPMASLRRREPRHSRAHTPCSRSTPPAQRSAR